MLDTKLLRGNPKVVKENIKKKFQDHKIELVDKVIAMDRENRSLKQRGDESRSKRNAMSKEVGGLMAEGSEDEANAIKVKVQTMAGEVKETEVKETELAGKIKEMVMQIPNIIHPTIPVGKDDSENIELQKYDEPVVPDSEIPYRTSIMERFEGIDLDSARKVTGNGFYYLMGDIVRLHSAITSYARNLTTDRRFTYVVSPFMIRSNVVTGVMGFVEMEGIVYKIEGEDLYPIGTNRHSMIERFTDTILDEKRLPYIYTSCSLCLRREKSAHGIKRGGVHHVHQFEKQEMIVVCKPEESVDWPVRLYTDTVDLFKNLSIPARTLEYCSDDFAGLKDELVDVEVWSPRRKKYFEVRSYSNLIDARTRRLDIRVKGENGKYFAHTSNNTVAVPLRMLIAPSENNPDRDGSVSIPGKLQPYMGDTKILMPKN